LRIDIGDDHLPLHRRRRDVYGAAADTAGADDHQMVVGADMLARLLQRRIGGDARAGVSRSEVLWNAVIRQQVTAVRHDHMRAVPAGDPRAEGARAQAEQLLALLAHSAFAAADPRISDDLVADLDARSLRTERDDLTSDLMTHREGQMHAARLQGDLL